MNSRALLLAASGSLFLLAAWRPTAPDVRWRDPASYHLGDDPSPEWTEAAVEPDGRLLDLAFELEAPDGEWGEWVLALWQRDVNEPWRVRLNGTEIALLDRVEERVQRFHRVPDGVLRDGENELSIVGDRSNDDITVGDFELHDRALADLLELGTVQVRVTDAASDEGLPCRITIANEDGDLARIYPKREGRTADRQGLVYTADGEARIELAAGRYRVYATRGSEWGLGEAPLTIGKGEVRAVDLAIAREVDTTGFVAADTHIHTYTNSGHGDSTLEERMVTLAGEGVELAIATDHNHNTDYRPFQSAAGLNEYFTPVTGNEVTTEIGHFNAFPLDPADEVPDYESTDLVQLVEGMRAKGAQVVILNHPRWPDHEKGPFGVIRLDRYTGERALDAPFTFDAMELVNSTTEEDDPLFLFRDWFALLNRGELIWAVGSSDSHTVGDPVGQGRTYVRSTSDDPARIDVDEACRMIGAGFSSIGMGIYVDGTVNGHTSGQLGAVGEAGIDVRLRIGAPSWVRPRRAMVFVNGIAAAERELHGRDGPFDERLELALDWPYRHDAWVVCVVLGDAVTGPYWRTLAPYTLAATNPVFLDGDGDGAYASPRASATERLAGGATVDALQGCDEAVTVQGLYLLRRRFLAEAHERARRAGASVGGEREHVRAFLDSLGSFE